MKLLVPSTRTRRVFPQRGGVSGLITLWKKVIAQPVVVSAASPAAVRLRSTRAVNVATAAPHSTPNSRIKVVRTLSNGGGLDLDNNCSSKLATPVSESVGH